MEGLSNRDAILLPLTAAITLATLYFLIKKYGADIVNLIFGYYFAAVGIFSVVRLVNDATNVVLSFVFPSYFRYKGSLVRTLEEEKKVVVEGPGKAALASEANIPAPWLRLWTPRWVKATIWSVRQSLRSKYKIQAYLAASSEMQLDANFSIVNVTILQISSAVVGIATVVYANTVSKVWFLTNLQGFAVSYSALQLLSPTTFTTASLILSALFCYDIWAVFFTPLMVSVAKDLDQPIKLVFPRPDEPSPTAGEPPLKSYSMLGLGDIVIPGIVIGLALRFDLYMYYLRKQKRGRGRPSIHTDINKGVHKAAYVPVTGRWGERFWTLGLPASSLPARISTSFPKPYFIASLIGYVVGMVVTLGIMSVFHHAQPALLYLVPGVLISLWGTALLRGEISEMWNFSEAETEEPQKPSEQKAAAEKSEDALSKGLFGRAWAGLWGDSSQTEGEKAENGEKSARGEKAEKPEKPEEGEKAKDAASDAPGVPIRKVSPGSIVVSFSFDRIPLHSNSASARPRKPGRTDRREEKEVIAASESSEDGIIVSSADLDEGHDLRRSPRKRIRSSKAA